MLFFSTNIYKNNNNILNSEKVTFQDLYFLFLTSISYKILDDMTIDDIKSKILYSFKEHLKWVNEIENPSEYFYTNINNDVYLLKHKNMKSLNEIEHFICILNIKKKEITINNKIYVYWCIYYVIPESFCEVFDQLYNLSIFFSILYPEELKNVDSFSKIESELLHINKNVSQSDKVFLKKQLKKNFDVLYNNFFIFNNVFF